MNDARREKRPRHDISEVARHDISEVARHDISEVTVKLSYTLFFLFALGAAGAVGAQQPRRITFNDAIAIALEQNLAVKQAKNATALTAATVQQQKMQLLPDLRLNVNGADNVGRNFSQTEAAITDQQTQSMNTSLSSSMALFDGMKTLSTGVG